MRKNNRAVFLFALLILVLIACNLPSTPSTQPNEVEISTAPQEGNPPPVVVSTSTASVVHVMNPASPISGNLVYDVESSGTAPEKRAPYGDSYDINRLERPFLQDMTYVSDMDIVNFIVSQDADWFYVSIKLVGQNPNNPLGIDYGIELDTDHDGFGDYVIVASPAYTDAWDASNVRIFQDTDHDTAGILAHKSDAPITTNGYETQIFHGGVGDADADMAWVRLSSSASSTLEFAFKKSWSGTVFMLGVFSDAGLKDVGKLDYVDRFTEAEAGSPIKDKSAYPLKALHSFDNTCQEAYGFEPTGYEPKLCPRLEPTPAPRTPRAGCTEPGQYSNQSSCEAAGCVWTQNSGVVIAVIYYCTYP
jgi:hypothetical protein